MRTAPTAAAALLLALAAAGCEQQQPAADGTQQAANRSGVNVGSLSCTVSGGVGFVFGSSRTLDCLFTRTDGVGEHRARSAAGASMSASPARATSCGVFAPGSIARGALAGEYAGASAQGTVGVGVGARF